MSPPTVNPRGRPTILVAEDNEDHRYLVELATAEAGLEANLAFAHDGAQALDFLRRQGEHRDAPDVDLLLLDLQMPRLDGFGVLQAIRQDADPLLRRLPVVVLTTSVNPSDVRRAYDLGANGFLPKPAEFTDFVRAMGTLDAFWFRWASVPSRP